MLTMNDIEWYGTNDFYILFGECDVITKIILENKHLINPLELKMIEEILLFLC